MPEPARCSPSVEELCPPDCSITLEGSIKLWAQPLLQHPPSEIDADFLLWLIRDRKRPANVFLMSCATGVAVAWIREKLVKERRISKHVPQLYIEEYDERNKGILRQFMNALVELWEMFQSEPDVRDEFTSLLQKAAITSQRLNKIYTPWKPNDIHLYSAQVAEIYFDVRCLYGRTHSALVHQFGYTPWYGDWYRALEIAACDLNALMS